MEFWVSKTLMVKALKFVDIKVSEAVEFLSSE